MSWHQLVFELIDMRSFSNLWFWIALAVLWSSTAHWVLGIPYDTVQRAKRHGGEAEADLRDLMRININRFLYINSNAGVWLLAGGCCVLTILGGLGFFYAVEFCQAVFLLLFPLSLIWLLSIRTAARLKALPADAPLDLLYQRLTRHRFHTQLIGMMAIFVTAFWGMWQNMNIGALSS